MYCIFTCVMSIMTLKKKTLHFLQNVHIKSIFSLNIIFHKIFFTLKYAFCTLIFFYQFIGKLIVKKAHSI